jgi:hypothetical protein
MTMIAHRKTTLVLGYKTTIHAATPTTNPCRGATAGTWRWGIPVWVPVSPLSIITILVPYLFVQCHNNLGLNFSISNVNVVRNNSQGTEPRWEYCDIPSCSRFSHLNPRGDEMGYFLCLFHSPKRRLPSHNQTTLQRSSFQAPA